MTKMLSSASYRLRSAAPCAALMPRFCTKGMVGCFMSHRRIWQKAFVCVCVCVRVLCVCVCMCLCVSICIYIYI